MMKKREKWSGKIDSSYILSLVEFDIGARRLCPFKHFKILYNPMPNQQSQAMPTGRQEVKIADNFAGAEYTNMAQFNHNKEEFQLVFFNVVANSGRVVSKIVTSPSHFKRMVVAMTDNLKKYETIYGQIDENKEVHSQLTIKN